MKGRSVWAPFFENDPLDKLKKMPSSKGFYIFRKMVKNAKWWPKLNLLLSHSQTDTKTAKFLKRVLKNKWPLFLTF